MTDDPDFSDPSLYINRELSWLAFNERVLAQARPEAHTEEIEIIDRAEKTWARR